MVGTIICVVNADWKQKADRGVLWIHLMSYVAGSALLGCALGALGGGLRAAVPHQWQGAHVLLITGLVSVLYSLRELELLRVPAPKVMRQVPVRWRLLRPPRQRALLYGLELGVGFTTYVTATTFYVASLWAFLVGSVRLGLLVMAAYGVGRAVPMLWMGRRPISGEQRNRLLEILSPWTPVVHYTNGLVLGFLGASLLTAGAVALLR
jgi:sulfite exporter TauE/SafE